MKGTFYVYSDPDLSGVLDTTAVTVRDDGVLLKQGNDIIALDVKQIKQLISELNGEFK